MEFQEAKDVNDFFKKLRMSKKTDMGLGDVRITISEQEAIIELLYNLESYIDGLEGQCR